MQLNPDIDKQIRKIFFPKRKLKDCSLDRNLAACVVDEIVYRDQNVKDTFNRIIHNKFAKLRKSDGTLKYDEFLLFCTPDEICEAAIAAIVENEK